MATALPHCGLFEDGSIAKDEPMLVFDVKDTSNPPAGTYRARFLGVKQIEHEEYGAGALFTWEIIEGEQTGKTAGRVTDINATLTNATGRIIAGIAGKQVNPGSVSVEEYIGRIYMIQLEKCKDSQKTRVGACMATA
jgi:hypothetical protein